jgi:predicted RNase H-like HicB family nuclease
MRFTALIHDSSEEGESGFCATCAEIPKAVGQGETVEDCLKDLRACIQFILENNRETALRETTHIFQKQDLVFA